MKDRRLKFSALRILTAAFLFLISKAYASPPIDIDLSAYGFKGISLTERVNGGPSRPVCLFLDNNDVVLITSDRENPKGLVTHGIKDSWRLHYFAVVVDLRSRQVVDKVDLGGGDLDTASETLSDGTLVFYRHGTIDFWKLGNDDRLQKWKTDKVDLQEINQAATGGVRIAIGSLHPSFSHGTLYLQAFVPLANIHKIWKITSDTIEPIDVHQLPLELGSYYDSDTSILGRFSRQQECSYYVIPYQARMPAYEIYHGNPCRLDLSAAFIGPHEIVFQGAPPEFATDTGKVISRPSVGKVGPISAAWDGSAYMGLLLRTRGRIEVLDMSGHISKAVATIFDSQWRQRCRLEMKIHGADLSGPYLSPNGDRIVAYDRGHLYAWDVNELSERPTSDH